MTIMSIDNPLDQVQALIASDERQQPPETVKRILNAISKLPSAEDIISLLQLHSEKQRRANSDLLITTI